MELTSLDLFFEKGYCVFKDQELASLFNDFPLDQITWTDDNIHEVQNFFKANPLCEMILLNAQIMIAQKYIQHISKQYKLTHKKIWQSFTEDQLNYHNDTYKQTEDSLATNSINAAQYNTLALLYLSDMSSYNEGAVWFTDGVNEERIIPKVGLLILVNCSSPHFMHKAEWTDKNRYLAQFGFKIENLENTFKLKLRLDTNLKDF